MTEQKFKTKLSWLLFILLLCIYHSDGYFQVSSDAIPNVYLPVSILSEGNLSFSLKEFPFMFRQDKDALKKDGKFKKYLKTREVYPGAGIFPDYYLIKTQYPGIYVNIFGIGSGLTALPVFAIIKAFYPGYANNPALLWRASKLVASLCAAGSAVLVFLIACYFLNIWPASLIALAYGLGTSIWSGASQTLWQQSPNILFLALGAWAMVRSQQKRDVSIAWSGAALGMAFLCRPTSAFAIIAVAGYLALTRRKELLKFILGGIPFAAVWVTYNLYYFDKMFFLGQAENSSKLLALAGTGSSDLWQTPFWEGAMGVLFSPARGIFIYSPFLLFTIPFAYFLFKDSRYRILTPFFIAATAMIMMIFKWYTWWGGWYFGYRLAIDAMPLLALALIPGMKYISSKKWISAVFAVTLVWSIGVQGLGAFSYDIKGWNDRQFYDVSIDKKHLRIPVDYADKHHLIEQLHKKYSNHITVRTVSGNIDLPENKHRLLSFFDNPILYYFLNFQKSRERRKQYIKSWLLANVQTNG